MYQNRQKLVRIRVCDHDARVDGAAEAVRDILTAACLEFAPRSTTACPDRMSIKEFYTERDDRTVVSPGLVPLIASGLSDKGWTVEVEDRRQFPRPLKLSRDTVENAADPDRPILRALQKNIRGQIEVKGTSGLTRTITLICKTFAECNVLVMTASMKRARHLWRSVRKSLSGQVRLERRKWQKQSRIVFCPYAYVEDPHAWQIILLPDAAELAGSAVAEKVKTALAGPQRIYTFFHRGWEPTRLQSLAAQSLAGPVIHAPDPGAAIKRQACIAREFLVPAAAPGLEQKRLRWHCRERNQLIASIASAFTEGNQPALWESGLMLSASDSAWMELAGKDIKVAVIVESSEHGQALRQMLPDWPLRSLAPGSAASTPATPQKREIVTQAYGEEIGIDANVVIRAEGKDDQRGVPLIPRPAADVPGGVMVEIAIADVTYGQSHKGTVRGPLSSTSSRSTATAGTEGPAADQAASVVDVQEQRDLHPLHDGPGRSRQSSHGQAGSPIQAPDNQVATRGVSKPEIDHPAKTDTTDDLYGKEDLDPHHQRPVSPVSMPAHACRALGRRDKASGNRFPMAPPIRPDFSGDRPVHAGAV